VAGLRPEDLELASSGAPGAHLGAVLELVEPVGNETFLTARAGEVELVLRTPPQTPARVGEHVTLSFRPERLHLFDAATGRRVPR
jgi:multiple sugar transport system ATP-binding protein